MGPSPAYRWAPWPCKFLVVGLAGFCPAPDIAWPDEAKRATAGAGPGFALPARGWPSILVGGLGPQLGDRQCFPGESANKPLSLFLVFLPQFTAQTGTAPWFAPGLGLCRHAKCSGGNWGGLAGQGAP